MTTQTLSARSLSTAFRWRATGLAMLSFLAFALAEQTIGVFIIAGTLAALSWWLVESTHARPLPRVVLNLGVLGASLLLLAEVIIFNQVNLLLALGHFMIALLVCKLFETKNSRDWAQILSLSLFVIATAAILSSSFAFGLVLAAYLALGIFTAVLFYLRVESTRADERQIAAEALPTSRAGGDLARTAWKICAALALFGVLVFASFPRGKGQPWLQFISLGNNNPVSGFSERVSFNSFGQLQLSDALVMHVTLTRNGQNAGSDYELPYFRGATFDVYDAANNTWVRSLQATQDTQSYSLVLHHAADLADPSRYNAASLLVQHYSLLVPTSSGILYAISPAIQIKSDALRTVVQNQSGLDLHALHSYPTLEYSVASPLHYDHELMPPPRPMPAGKIGYEGAALPPFTIPAPLVAKAKEIVGDLLPATGAPLTGMQARRIANRISSYLQEHYQYSTRISPVDRSLDPTTDFVLNRHAGYCEYFASAMIMLSRAVGLQGRMVTGYLGGEYNAVGGFYAVRARDAHAWAEIYIPGYGWERYDATPSESVDDTTTPLAGPLKWMREISEVVQRYWNQAVVAFDNSSRATLTAWLVNPFKIALLAIIHSAVWLAHSTPRYFLSPQLSWPVRLFRGTLTLIPLIGLGYAAVVTIKRHKLRWLRRLVGLPSVSPHELPRHLRFIDEAMNILSHAGVPHSRTYTPREYVAKVRQRVQQCPAEADWLVNTFYELRYGRAAYHPELRGQIRGALGRLSDALQAKNEAV